MDEVYSVVEVVPYILVKSLSKKRRRVHCHHKLRSLSLPNTELE